MGIALRQDGYAYFAIGQFYVTNTQWTTQSVMNLSANDFFAFSTNVNGYAPMYHPDFSSTGHEIQFGVYQRLFTPAGGPAVSTDYGMDNISITINYVPEPGVAALGVIGFVGLFTFMRPTSGVFGPQGFVQEIHADPSPRRVLRRRGPAHVHGEPGALVDIVDVSVVRPMAEQPCEDRRRREIYHQEPAHGAAQDARMVEVLADGPNPWARSIPQHGIRQRAEFVEDGFALLVQQVQVSRDRVWHTSTSTQSVPAAELVIRQKLLQ
jgi:hypothetical protein